MSETPSTDSAGTDPAREETARGETAGAAMIVTRGLTRRFGPKVAVDGIDLTIAKGEVLGFLGPNGAGKSTTMKMITGFLPPSAGTAEVAGFDILKQPEQAKRRLGYLPEGAPAYADMTPKSFLTFVADLRGLTGRHRKQRLEFVVERTHINHVWQQPIETLSKGFKRRVGMAQAILHDPDVLIMDEPTDGLDPNQKHEVRTLIQELAAEKCIVVSTHILEEVAAVCTRAVVIAHGRLLADGAPRALEARSRWHNAVTITVDADHADALRNRLAAHDTVSTVEGHPAGTGAAGQKLVQLRLFPNPGAALPDAVAGLFRSGGALADSAVAVHDITVQRGRLDEVFREITTGSAEPPPPGAPVRPANESGPRAAA